MTAPCALTFPTDRQFILGVVGDSITQRGSFASDVSKTWVELVRARIATQCPQGVNRIDSVTHHDAGGNTALNSMAAAYRLWQSDPANNTNPLPSCCDMVIVGLGTNDCREQDSSGNWIYTQSQTYADAETIYAAVVAQNPSAVVFGLGVWNNSLLTWYNPGSRTARWDSLIGERCHENGGIWVPVSDLWDYAPNRLVNGLAGQPAFGGYTTDGFHPNDTGHAAIATRAANALRLP